MNSYLKNYTIELTTLAPVFIGSGEQLGKKEYIYDKDDKKAWIFDKKILYKHILEEKLSDAYESYILGKNGDLYVWMKENAISKSTYSIWAKYCLDCSYTDLTERNRDISLFVKDPYDLPYIPGSSLKGAIRTALLGYKLSKNSQMGQLQSDIRYNSRARNRNELSKKLSGFSRILEETFHTLEREKVKKENAVCDELSGMRISDSKPMSVKDLILCQKIDKNIDGKDRVLPIFRECLKPKIKIYFDMTIDESICNYRKEDILEAVKYFFYNTNKQYKKYGALSPDRKYVITIGGGAGYISKTDPYNMYSDKEAVQVVSNILETYTPKAHGHRGDSRKGVSPHTLKITKYSGRTYQFGQCEIKITES